MSLWVIEEKDEIYSVAKEIIAEVRASEACFRSIKIEAKKILGSETICFDFDELALECFLNQLLQIRRQIEENGIELLRVLQKLQTLRKLGDDYKRKEHDE